MILFLVIFITISIVMVYIIIKYFTNVVCGGRIDPTLRYCDTQSNLVTGKKIPEDKCNPVDNIKYDISFNYDFSKQDIEKIINNGWTKDNNNYSMIIE